MLDAPGRAFFCACRLTPPPLTSKENAMNTRFELAGPLTELSSYPIWAQDMIADCQQAKQTVVDHELFAMMSEAKLDQESTANFMLGIWPVIERFPGYMALNLLKTQFGRSVGDNLARRWLVRNIRVEQNHAEHWLTWAEGAGVPRETVLRGRNTHQSTALSNWCEEVAKNDSLAAGMAATNYAVEGVTGEWSQFIYESEAYKNSIPVEARTGTLRWLQLHAAYDDTHPWEALEIVCTLMGTAPTAYEVAHLGECIRRSYVSMSMLADRCVMPTRAVEAWIAAAA
jgi:pyrroloquinoline quinone (PQQ) biosynthesis protein C